MKRPAILDEDVVVVPSRTRLDGGEVMSDIVEHIKFLRQWAADIRESSGQSVDADRLEAISLALSEARSAGRANGMEEAARILEEGFDRGIKRKQDTCDHGKFEWEDCDQCCAAAIRAAKEPQ